MPPILAALTGFGTRGAEFSGPYITAVEMTGPGPCPARVDGDAAERRVLGRHPDVLRGWLGFISRRGLSPREFIICGESRFFGPSNA